MAKEIKFTEEEVGKINSLRQDVSNLFVQLGQLQVEKRRRVEEIENLENELLNKHSALVQNEKDMFSELNGKYGDGNYDPSSNTFVPVSENKETK
jgi:hypothetical protein